MIASDVTIGHSANTETHLTTNPKLRQTRYCDAFVKNPRFFPITFNGHKTPYSNQPAISYYDHLSSTNRGNYTDNKHVRTIHRYLFSEKLHKPQSISWLSTGAHFPFYSLLNLSSQAPAVWLLWPVYPYWRSKEPFIIKPSDHRFVSGDYSPGRCETIIHYE